MTPWPPTEKTKKKWRRLREQWNGRWQAARCQGERGGGHQIGHSSQPTQQLSSPNRQDGRWRGSQAHGVMFSLCVDELSRQKYLGTYQCWRTWVNARQGVPSFPVQGALSGAVRESTESSSPFPSQKNYTTIVRTKDLDSSLMVVSDSSEAVTLLLSNQIVTFLNKNASSVEYIHLSDLYTGAARDR
ncbi:hypothetical protein EMCRGX_G012696 [Ephydatia muelleri]